MAVASASTSLCGHRGPVTGLIGEVHTTQMNDIYARAFDNLGNEYIYLKGVASTIVGSVVTFSGTTGVTALIVADISGPVAIATGLTVASTWGWYGINGIFPTDVVANSAAFATTAKNPGRETTDGKVGDGRAAGDEIIGMIQLLATTAAAIVNTQINYPSVNNFTGA